MTDKPPPRALARREQTRPVREQGPPVREQTEVLATRPPGRGRAHLLDRWLKTKSAPTVRAYEEDLERFAVWAVAVGRMEPPATARVVVAWLLSQTAAEASEIVYDYRAELLAQTPKRAAKGRTSLAPATINRRLSAIRSVIKAGQDLHYIDWTIRIAGVDNPDKVPPKPVVLEDEDQGDGDYGRRAVIRLRAYLDAMCESEDGLERELALRDRAIVRLLYDCALRRMEVVGFDWPEHVDTRRGLLHVLGKDRETREPFPLDQPIADTVRAWIAARGREPGPLFVPLDRRHRGKSMPRLSLGGVNKIVARIRTAAGVAIKPHDFRRVAVTRALELHGGDAAKVMAFSRHRNIATVVRYNLQRKDMPREIARSVARDDEAGDE